MQLDFVPFAPSARTSNGHLKSGRRRMRFNDVRIYGNVNKILAKKPNKRRIGDDVADERFSHAKSPNDDDGDDDRPFYSSAGHNLLIPSHLKNTITSSPKIGFERKAKRTQFQFQLQMSSRAREPRRAQDWKTRSCHVVWKWSAQFLVCRPSTDALSRHKQKQQQDDL